MFDISIIIPTYNAASFIGNLISMLENQTVAPKEIIIIDSSSEDGTLEIAGAFSSVKTIEIAKEDFNHGLTRHAAFLQTNSDIVGYMTQDAIPLDDRYLEKLIEPFENETIGMSYGRQIAKENARRHIELVQRFNYPEKPNIKSMNDIETLGIKTFFASDVCSAYRAAAYKECGGFKEVNTSEDMLIAASMLERGWSIAYVPDAIVKHSHNYSFRQQYERNRETGFFLESHSEDFHHAKEIGEGARLVRYVAKSLICEKKIYDLALFAIDCVARYCGNRKGRTDAKKLHI